MEFIEITRYEMIQLKQVQAYFARDFWILLDNKTRPGQCLMVFRIISPRPLHTIIQCLHVLCFIFINHALVCLFWLFGFSFVFFPLSVFPFITSPVHSPPDSLTCTWSPHKYLVFVLCPVFVSLFGDVPCYLSGYLCCSNRIHRSSSASSCLLFGMFLVLVSCFSLWF